MKFKFSKLGAAVLASAFAIPIFLTPATATAAKCGDRATLIETLKTRYKEVPVAMGISQKSTEAFEVFASETGSWTVVMTRSNGLACVMAVGHSWQDLPKQLAGTQS